MSETASNLDAQFAATQTANINASTPGNIGTTTNRISMPNTGSQQQNQGQLFLNVTNQVDSRSIKTVTMSNIGYQAFESIANLVKPGQSLDTYCDSEVRHQINVNLAIAKLADPHFAVDSKSEITDIIHAMKNFYNKGLQLKKARSFVDTFRYEHSKDPEKTLIEKDSANTEWNKNLGILTTLVDEEKLSEEETIDIIKKLIRLLGTSATGKKVQAVRGIKKELEDEVAGRNPIKTVFDFQVRF